MEREQTHITVKKGIRFHTLVLCMALTAVSAGGATGFYYEREYNRALINQHIALVAQPAAQSYDAAAVFPGE